MNRPMNHCFFPIKVNIKATMFSLALSVGLSLLFLFIPIYNLIDVLLAPPSTGEVIAAFFLLPMAVGFLIPLWFWMAPALLDLRKYSFAEEGIWIQTLFCKPRLVPWEQLHLVSLVPITRDRYDLRPGYDVGVFLFFFPAGPKDVTIQGWRRIYACWNLRRTLFFEHSPQCMEELKQFYTGTILDHTAAYEREMRLVHGEAKWEEMKTQERRYW